MGLLFTVFIARETLQSARVYTWPSTTCTILSSAGRLDAAVADTKPPYAFDVAYRYTWQGRDYTSSRLSRTAPNFTSWSKVRRLEDRFPPGAPTSCYLNPSEPSDAVLIRPSLWLALFVPLPLVFVAIGGGGLYVLWFRASDQPASLSISERARRKGKSWGLPLLFAILTIAGAAFSFYFYDPVRVLISARSWAESQCQVQFSRVGVHDGDDSTTYSIDVLYSWRVSGREYRSSRYGLFAMSSSGRSAKQRRVEQLPAGASVPCYINPRDPEDAILNRDFTPLLFIGLVPLGVFAAGVLGLLSLKRKPTPHPPDPYTDAFGKLYLKPAASPFAKFAGCGCVTLIWNGIVSIFVWQVVADWRQGQSPLGETLVLSVFVAGGLFGIGWLGYLFFGLFCPKPLLILTPRRLILGNNANLEWRFTHGGDSVQTFRIQLEGREEATYARGTTTAMDREVFYTATVLDVSPSQGLAEGFATLKIPAATMHTFEAPHNKIVWTLKVKGVIRRWPDIDLEFPLKVEPAARSAQP